MDKSDLRNLSKIRIKEAKALFNSGHFNGAYYLAGYAIECAIKTYISGQIKSNVVPEKTFTQHFYQHDLEKLMRFAGLWSKFETEMNITKALAVNWAIVKDWNEASRYDLSISQAKVTDMLNAITARNVGILGWIKRCT